MSSNTQLRVFNKSAMCFFNPKESFLACPTEVKFLCRSKEDDCIADLLLLLFLTLQFCYLCDLYQMVQREFPLTGGWPPWCGHWTDQLPGADLQPRPKFLPAFRRKKMHKNICPENQITFQWDLRLYARTVLNSLEKTEKIQAGIEVQCSQLDSNLSSPPDPQAWRMPHRLCFSAQSQNRDSPARSTATQQLQLKGIGLFLFAPVKMLTLISARLWSTDSRWISERPVAALQLVPSASAHVWGCFTYL